MLEILEPLREMTIVSVILRMVLALICGGIVGIEREYKRRPAGFRTHILICLGAAMTTLTSEYLFLVMNYSTDLGRLGAQVIAGVGFIGAGTIIVTRRQRVKGLTTAAGLWTCAIVGLAIGAGFYEGALITTALMMLVELFLSRLEYKILASSPEMNIYIEYNTPADLDDVIELLRRKDVSITGMEITRSTKSGGHNACAILSLRLNRRINPDVLNGELSKCGGVMLVQEL